MHRTGKIVPHVSPTMWCGAVSCSSPCWGASRLKGAMPERHLEAFSNTAVRHSGDRLTCMRLELKGGVLLRLTFQCFINVVSGILHQQSTLCATSHGYQKRLRSRKSQLPVRALVTLLAEQFASHAGQLVGRARRWARQSERGVCLQDRKPSGQPSTDWSRLPSTERKSETSLKHTMRSSPDKAIAQHASHCCSTASSEPQTVSGFDHDAFLAAPPPPPPGSPTPGLVPGKPITGASCSGSVLAHVAEAATFIASLQCRWSVRAASGSAPHPSLPA